VVSHWRSCPGRWWGHHPWRCSRTMEMWHWGTWSVGMVGWVGVGLDHLRGLFQLQCFYDSMNFIYRKPFLELTWKLPIYLSEVSFSFAPWPVLSQWQSCSSQLCGCWTGIHPGNPMTCSQNDSSSLREGCSGKSRNKAGTKTSLLFRLIISARSKNKALLPAELCETCKSPE